MYGIVNRAVEDLVCEKYGEDKWLAIKKKSNIDIDFFVSNEPYPDEVTYHLVGAIHEELQLPVDEILVSIGEWWVLRTGKEKYGSLMEAGGNSLREFLVNLPLFHNRIMLIYPKLTPPEFKVTDLTENSIHVHYFSKRAGLKEFVRGLLQGLGKMYNVPLTIELISSRDEGGTHEIFKLTWP